MIGNQAINYHTEAKTEFNNKCHLKTEVDNSNKKINTMLGNNNADFKTSS